MDENVFAKIREESGTGNPFPMVFTLKETEEGFSITPVDAQGVEGPPIRGKTPSDALKHLALAMHRAEVVADKLLQLIVADMEDAAADSAQKN